jgi:hypothetical protein
MARTYKKMNMHLNEISNLWQYGAKELLLLHKSSFHLQIEKIRSQRFA